MSTVIQRGKMWYAQWQQNGKTKMQKTGVRVEMPGKTAKETRELAQQLAANNEQASKGGRTMTEMLDCTRAAAVSFGLGKNVPSVRDYLNSIPRTTAPSSEKNRVYAHRAFLAYLEDRADLPLHHIGVADCSGFIRDCQQKGYKKGSICLHKTYLSAAFKRAAVEDGYISDNPWEAPTVSAAVRAIAAGDGRQGFAVAQMLVLLYDMGEANQVWSDLAAVSALLAGSRLSDCCLLRWDAVDMEHSLVYFREKKTKYSRCVALVPELRERLLRIRKEQAAGEEYVFPSLAREYTLNGSNNISSKFTKILRELGISPDKQEPAKGRGHRVSPLSFHSIRHFVCSLTNEQSNFSMSMSAVGHKSAAVHQRYVHISPDAQRGVLQGVAGALAPVA